MKFLKRGRIRILSFIIVVLVVILLIFLIKNNWDMGAAAQDMLGLFRGRKK